MERNTYLYVYNSMFRKYVDIYYVLRKCIVFEKNAVKAYTDNNVKYK